MDHQTIRMLLLSAGWKEKDIIEALTSESLGMQVPVPPDRGGAREAFIHVLSFASLYAMVISLIVLYFRFINETFSDIAIENRYVMDSYSDVRWSLAVLIVTFPVFLWMTHMIHKDMKKNPEKEGSNVRRWLTYVTLFVTAIALIGDGITLVFHLLEGELSIRFLLKVLIVFIAAGMTFSYYLLSLKSSYHE